MLSRVGIFLSIFFVGTIFYLLKIDIAKNFGWIMGLGILVVVVLFVLRFKYFEEIPLGWGYREFKAYQKIKNKTKGSFWDDGFNKKYWLIVLGICAILVSLGIVLNSNMFTGIPSILTVSFLVFVAITFMRNAKKMSKSEMQKIKDNNVIRNAKLEADYGNLKKRGLKTMIIVGSIVMLFTIFLVA